MRHQPRKRDVRKPSTARPGGLDPAREPVRALVNAPRQPIATPNCDEPPPPRLTPSALDQRKQLTVLLVQLHFHRVEQLLPRQLQPKLPMLTNPALLRPDKLRNPAARGPDLGQHGLSGNPAIRDTNPLDVVESAPSPPTDSRAASCPPGKAATEKRRDQNSRLPRAPAVRVARTNSAKF